MVGNSSFPAIALSAFALQATFRTPCHIVAEEASVTVQNVRSRRKHLRRQVDSTNELAERPRAVWTGAEHRRDGGNERGPSERMRERLRHTLESLGAAFLEERSPLPIEGRPRSSSESIVDRPSSVVTKTKGGADNGCTSRQWYPVIDSPTITCTNAHQSSAWADPSIIEAVLFDSPGECCDALVDLVGGGECSIFDDCGASATSADSRRRLSCSKSIGFHPDTTSEKGCTNNLTYPPPWLRPGLKEKMFYPTAEACCNWFFKDSSCPIEDICAGQAAPPPANTGPPPTPKPKPTPVAASDAPPGGCWWHVDVSAQDGCTNDLNYPPQWVEGQSKTNMMHATGTICCQKMFGSKPCQQRNKGCTKPTPPPKRTSPPTRRPTPRPTGRPTRPPTPRPTSEPTPKPEEFWVDDMTGLCLSDRGAKPKPHWISLTYFNYNQCCMAGSTNSEKCLKNRPAGGDEPSPFGAGQFGPPATQWYVDESSGICVSDDEKPKPDWVEQLFNHYDRCCQESINKKLCMKARPTTVDGKPLGTLLPTPTPPTMYFIDHTTGMCVSESENQVPSYAQATFEDFNRCCVLESSDPEKCLAMDPSTEVYDSYYPTPAPPSKFYVQDTTGVCVDENAVPMPYDNIKTYDDYDECCARAWNGDLCLVQRPTLLPTTGPTWSPSTPWPTEAVLCPETYDPFVSTYRSGNEVEVNLVVYRCKPPPYSAYCNKLEFQPPQEDPGPETKTSNKIHSKSNNGIPIAGTGGGGGGGSQQLWKEAWERLYQCVNSPTAYPTVAPSTPSPTCKTRWHPGAIDRRICTNSADYPAIWEEDPILSVAYFVDTADECCVKFYNGKRCRIKDVCTL